MGWMHELRSEAEQAESDGRYDDAAVLWAAGSKVYARRAVALSRVAVAFAVLSLVLAAASLISAVA